jgi:hypothetical protein
VRISENERSDVTENITHYLRGGNSNASGVKYFKLGIFLNTPSCIVPRNQTVYMLKDIFIH